MKKVIFVLLATISLSIMGTIDPQMEHLIRDVLEENGLARTMEVTPMGESFQSFAAISYHYSSDKPDEVRTGLFINQEKMRHLTPEEQCFVILHEIGHLKDELWKGPVCTVMPSVLALCVGCGVWLATRSESLWKSILKTGAYALATKYAGDLVSCYLLRKLELQADAYAFTMSPDLAAAAGAITKKDLYFPKAVPQSLWGLLLDDHPSKEQRIAALQKISEA